jgi:hypothetical protein
MSFVYKRAENHTKPTNMSGKRRIEDEEESDIEINSTDSVSTSCSAFSRT